MYLVSSLHGMPYPTKGSSAPWFVRSFGRRMYYPAGTPPQTGVTNEFVVKYTISLGAGIQMVFLAVC